MFNWFDKLLVKIAKKILNKYAPTGEFIAYINEQEEKVLKKLGGYGQPINETGIKSFISLGEIWESTVDFFQDNKDTIVDVGMGIGKAWIDMNDQERKNAVTEKAYNDYMAQVEAAGKEAESAVALNLTPMEITNVPQTKADVSSFTAVAARGGLMNLPTRHRKRYASQGFVEDDVEIMDPESLGDHELRMEEGVNVGPMVEEDKQSQLLRAFAEYQAGGGKLSFETFAMVWMRENAAQGGIIGLRNGGRPGYRFGDQVGITAIPRPAMATKDGIMDLGGMEKDYRTTGGFVPIGAYEKKDDVPARLSKNEFVMTADAVRAAGGGSINKGAQRMYDTMKHLEAQPQAKRMTA